MLNGVAYLVNPPMVGHATRIRMSNPTMQVPDPRCDDGRVLNIPVPIQTWSVAERPVGGTANLTSSGVEAELTPDRSGSWRVVYTACPNGCYIPLIRMTLPARSEALSFTAVPVVEGRLSSRDIDGKLKLLLADSRIQISQTSNGTPVAGTAYTVHWNPPAYKWQQLCTEPPNAPPTWTPSPVCDPDNRAKTLHTVSSAEWSYIDFGPTAVSKAKAPEAVALPVGIVERDVQSDIVRGALFVDTLGLFDIDRIRLLINNVHLELKDIGKWEASFGNGVGRLVLNAQSSHPAVICEGHWRAGLGYWITLFDGWADEMCPDFDLSTMRLEIKLVPTAQDGLLTVSDVQTAVDLEPQGVRSELIDQFVGATTIAEQRISTILRSKLMETQTRAALGMLLTRGFQAGYPDLCRVWDARVVGTDLVVLYQKTPQSASDAPCTSPLPPA